MPTSMTFVIDASSKCIDIASDDYNSWAVITWNTIQRLNWYI